MLDMQEQESGRVTVVGMVYRAVAESSDAFQEDIEKRLEEKKAARARQLLESKKSKESAEVIVSVSKSNIDAAAGQTRVSVDQVAPDDSRGGVVDINA